MGLKGTPITEGSAYLMQLNTLAGRSYNDISQPIGALNDDPLKKFQERYSSCNDPVIRNYGRNASTTERVFQDRQYRLMLHCPRPQIAAIDEFAPKP